MFFYNTHNVLVGFPQQGVGGLAISFVVSLNYFVLVYFYHTHHVLAGHPQGVGGHAILSYFICY
jgi:hypothetical protein